MTNDEIPKEINRLTQVIRDAISKDNKKDYGPEILAALLFVADNSASNAKQSESSNIRMLLQLAMREVAHGCVEYYKNKAKIEEEAKKNDSQKKSKLTQVK